MPISKLERAVKFSNHSLEEYNLMADVCKKQLLSVLESNNNFKVLLESKSSYIKPKNTLKEEASKLANSSIEAVSKFGKAVLKFLATGAKGIDDLCIAISMVLMAGGTALSVCISLLIAIILFAITVVPFAILCKGLVGIDKTLGSYLHTSEDKNVKKYRTLSMNIQKQKNGIKDIRDLEKIVNVSESLNDVISMSEMVPVDEAKSLINLINEIENRGVNTKYDNAFKVLEMGLGTVPDLAPSHLTYISNNSVMESVNNINEDNTSLLESYLSRPLLSTQGVLEGILTITTEPYRYEILESFINKYKNTVEYEATHEAYRDIPIWIASKVSLEFVKERCFNIPSVLESCNELESKLYKIVESTTEEVKEDGFNPCPFNLGSLTPLPVASRKIDQVICDIELAETDEEITEALLNFGRVAKIVNENYYVSEVDGVEMIIEGKVAKAARRAETKAQKNFSKIAIRDKAKGVKQAIKKTVDPIEKFILDKYKLLKEKDANERRKVIMAGGMGWLYKILRWLKRAIPISAGLVVGQVIPVASTITAIGLIGLIVTDGYFDKKERNKILRELDDEIMICNEKIDDSRGDDNKQKKYELMRIRNELQKTRDKIHYGLKY